MVTTRTSWPKKYSDNNILLDTGSTCSVFKNANMLINIVRRKYRMRAMTNGGHQDSHCVGLFPGFFEIYYNHKSLLNILSTRDVRKHFRVTMDTEVEAAMNVHLKDGKILKFKEVEPGLYMFCPIIKVKNNREKVSSYYFLTLVSGNKSNFTRWEMKMADLARAL